MDSVINIGAFADFDVVCIQIPHGSENSATAREMCCRGLDKLEIRRGTTGSELGLSSRHGVRVECRMSGGGVKPAG